jgi:DNA-binding GntR family transcriptional regulator
MRYKWFDAAESATALMPEDTENSARISPLSARRSLADEVSVRLREGILRGRFAPGEQLQPTRLAEKMEISPGPVREALRRLEREGLVIMQHGRTPIVADLSLEDLDEIFSLRNCLEQLAAQYACRKGSDADWQAMENIIDTLSICVARGITEEESAELDLQFHDLLYQATKHQRLIAFWSDLRPQIHVFLLRRNLADAHFPDVAVSGHREVLEALKSRDERRAVDVIEKHLWGGFDWVKASHRRAESTIG